MVELPQNKNPDRQVSYDLGWLIQNEKISDKEFCAFLLSETSTEIERLVSRLLQSPADRIAVVDQTLFNVLLRRRSYKSDISGKTWLYRITLEECLKRTPHRLPDQMNLAQRLVKVIDTHLAENTHFNRFLDSLPAEQRLFVILHYGQNLAVEEIAFLLKMEKGAVQSALEQSQQQLMAHQRSCEECLSLSSSLTLMETSLVEAFQINSQLMDTAHENNADWIRSLLERLSYEKRRLRTRKWASRAAEFSLGVLILLFSEMAFTHSLPVLPWSAQPTERVTGQSAAILPTHQPSPVTPTPLPTAVAIKSQANLDEVLKFSLTSWARWHSLWADVNVNYYYLLNYNSTAGKVPDQSLRKQIWLSLPGSSRLVSGQKNGSPDIAYSILNAKITGQNFASGQMIDSPTSNLIPDIDLQQLFSPIDMYPDGGQYTFIGNDTIIGRPTWVLEWSINGQRVYRFWIDQEYGVILRRLGYAQVAFPPVISDILVTNIYFNPTFPDTIFEPYLYKGDHFANDFSGDPEINDVKTALQDWTTSKITLSTSGNYHPSTGDSSNAHLSFQPVQMGYLQNKDGGGLELFADQVDLGKVPLGGKTLQTCQRSPDGSRIAYNSPPLDSSGNTALYIADLASLASARPALAGGITAGDFAFSPDNSRLAFFGCEKASGFCGVFILDLKTWQLTPLAPLNYADYMVWSPDGHSIAMVGKNDLTEANKKVLTTNLLMNEVMALAQSWFFQVFDSSNGNVTYKRAFEWSNLSAPSDSPTNSWSTPFKIPTAGVQGCINPPKKAVSGGPTN